MARRRIDWSEQPLGQVADAELAAALGVSVFLVARARRSMGIPGLRITQDAERLAGPERVDVDWDSQPLGELPDLELAKRLGVHRSQVRLARVHRQIPVFVREGRRMVAPTDPEALRAREARWHLHPLTDDKCRYCAEASKNGSVRSRAGTLVRWTDQGPSCLQHYVSLPPCPRCAAPVTHAGDYCEECTTSAIRNEREHGRWRSGGQIMPPTVARGDVHKLSKALDAIEKKQAKGKVGCDENNQGC